MEGTDKDSVDVVVLSGHGAGGGVQSSGGGLVPWALTPGQIKEIKEHTAKDAVIVICACSQGGRCHDKEHSGFSDHTGAACHREYWQG
ncbi:hypothetical protein OAG68_01275 [bacterium]|nr:hypothetical protein [bacterium]